MHPLSGKMRIDPAMVCFDSPSAEGEPKTQAGALDASLLERTEKLSDVAPLQTAAFVLNLNQHALGTSTDA